MRSFSLYSKMTVFPGDLWNKTQQRLLMFVFAVLSVTVYRKSLGYGFTPPRPGKDNTGHALIRDKLQSEDTIGYIRQTLTHCKTLFCTASTRWHEVWCHGLSRLKNSHQAHSSLGHFAKHISLNLELVKARVTGRSAMWSKKKGRCGRDQHSIGRGDFGLEAVLRLGHL